MEGPLLTVKQVKHIIRGLDARTHAQTHRRTGRDGLPPKRVAYFVDKVHCYPHARQMSS